MFNLKLRIFISQKKVSDICLIASLFIMIALLFFSSSGANAQMEELEKVAGGAGIKGEADVAVVVGRIIGVVLSFLGLILVILIIYGGFLWMTSGGNEEQIKKAKGIIGSAIIGLGIVILSYTIASFVINRLQNISQPTS